MTYTQVVTELKQAANPIFAKNLARFFKTGKGEYGEGDIFLGIKVPIQRQIAKKYKDLKLSDVQKLLSGKYHEHRLTGLLILTYKYPKATPREKEEIIKLYLKNTRNINNWDLVDLSAHKLLGQHLYDQLADKKILTKFAHSIDLWERRIAVLSTFAFINNKQYKEALQISEILVNDKHDLIHKAVGWMLREIGKKDLTTEEKFLQKHYKTMPRTMLRYAIERFPEEKRKFYMGKK